MFSKYWKISDKVRYLKKQNKNKQTNLHDYIQKNSVKNIKENQILDFGNHTINMSIVFMFGYRWNQSE